MSVLNTHKQFLIIIRRKKKKKRRKTGHNMKLNCKHFSFFVVIACVSRENMAFVEIILPYFDYDFSLAPWSWGIKKKKNQKMYRVSLKYHFKGSLTYRPFFIPLKTYSMKLRNVFHILAKDTEKYEVSRTHNLNCLVERKSLCSNYRKRESIADNPP